VGLDGRLLLVENQLMTRLSRRIALAEKLTPSRRALMKLVEASIIAGGGGDGSPGSNKNITKDILMEDARGYNGAWSGEWVADSAGKLGTVRVQVTIDPEARTLTADFTIEGDLLQDGISIGPFSVSGSADYYTYSDEGVFSIHKQTPLGDATLANGGNIGSGKFILQLSKVTGHAGVSGVRAEGVANRGGEIPTTFTITRSDGSKVTGNVRFTQ
jgi:hypothetical protein